MLSALAADHVQRPRNQGPLETFDRYGLSGCPGDGPHAEVWLALDGERIVRAAYRTHGCPSSIAACSMLCQVATGRDVDRILALEPSDLLTLLGGLPEGRERFAAMAIESMRDALRQENDDHA